MAAAAAVAAGVFLYKDGQRLFTDDERLGWKGIAGAVRRPAGPNGPWTVAYDAEGFRSQPQKAGVHERTLLILGDSFCFGEGVGLDERFDSLIARRQQKWKIVNRCISGYSPDQALMAGEPVLARLGRGDIVLLTLFGDDLRGLISERFAGRKKPRRPLADGLGEIEQGARIFDALAAEHLTPAARRGVRVVLTLHGGRVLDAMHGPGTAARVSDYLSAQALREGYTYLPMLDAFESDATHPPGDIHWNAAGHRRYFELVIDALLEYTSL